MGYSWAGQLYSALRTEYQLIKRIGAGLTGFSVEKIAYRGRKKLLDFVHELHELTRMFPNDKMATGSVARICTNARRCFI